MFSGGFCNREFSPSRLQKTKASVIKYGTAVCQGTLEHLKCYFLFVTIWGKSVTLHLFGFFLSCSCLRILLSTCQASLRQHKRVCFP